MIQIKTAGIEDIENIAQLRALQQIEDWENTDKEKYFSQYRQEFIALTAEYLHKQLNRSIYFEIMYDGSKAIAICAIEEIKGLPQVTACITKSARAGSLAGVYTLPEHRGKGFQQMLLRCLLDYARSIGFSTITLTTNTPDAKHIYKKLGFKYISDKLYLSLI